MYCYFLQIASFKYASTKACISLFSKFSGADKLNQLKKHWNLQNMNFQNLFLAISIFGEDSTAFSHRCCNWNKQKKALVGDRVIKEWKKNSKNIRNFCISVLSAEWDSWTNDLKATLSKWCSVSSMGCRQYHSHQTQSLYGPWGMFFKTVF